MPGVTDTGNHCDDCDTMITLPFAFYLYRNTYNTVNVDSNGTAQFVSNSSEFSPACLPWVGHDYTIFPFWTDLRTDTGLSGCSNFANGCGIFTSVSGTAPNRVFYIEWHAVLYNNNASASDFEVVLFENNPNVFEIIYGTMNATGNYVMMVGGDQGNSGAGQFTQVFCLPSSGLPPSNESLHYDLQCATPTPTPPASPTCTPTTFRVLIAYADLNSPTQLQSEILAEPGVTAVDLFDAGAGTPTLAQLQQYNIVVPLNNSTFQDATTLGNNLADYVDGGGIVVQYGFSHYGPGQPHGVNGRWVSGNYNPYDYSTNLEFTAFTLGSFNAGHPLMAGVTMLNSNDANIVTPAAGATEVAANNLGESLVAYRPVSGGHTTVGVTAYVGYASTQSGHWGRVIVNAGRWLITPPCGTPTPTPTPYSDSYGSVNCYADSDSHADADGNSYIHTYSHAYSYSIVDRYAYIDAGSRNFDTYINGYTYIGRNAYTDGKITQAGLQSMLAAGERTAETSSEGKTVIKTAF